jgi:hypothetical protein
MEPKYITFEQAKWLKEKGFNEPCDSIYKEDGEFQSYKNVGDIRTHFNNSEPINPKTWHRYDTSAPEQHQVVDWIWTNYGIWISLGLSTENVFYYHGYNSKNSKKRFFYGVYFSSPQEAYSAAFDYIKNNNLI